MKPINDWTFADAVFYLCGAVFLLFLLSVALTVLGTLAGAILAFASTGIGAVIIIICGYLIYKKLQNNKKRES